MVPQEEGEKPAGVSGSTGTSELVIRPNKDAPAPGYTLTGKQEHCEIPKEASTFYSSRLLDRS